MSDFEMKKNAHVEVVVSHDQKGNPIARAVIDGDFEHDFAASSRISKALDTMTPTDLAERLTGGDFFIMENQLMDFRDGQYNGFVHSDESISKLIEVIGVTNSADQRKRNRENTTNTNISLSSIWSEQEIEVPLYSEGGQFNSQLRFKWNPFTKDVNSTFELVRLICTNGMVGLTPFLNTKIPLINRWEEHLEIASRQIQNKVSSKVIGRLGEMGDERATVAECQNLLGHVTDRLKDGNVLAPARDALKNISGIVSPLMHLSDTYKQSVFEDRRLGAQLPSHLSTFDLYNMVTEVNSHTTETSNSSDHALDKMANALVFDREDLTKHQARFGAPSISAFSDPEAAFFGKQS